MPAKTISNILMMPSVRLMRKSLQLKKILNGSELAGYVFQVTGPTDVSKAKTPADAGKAVGMAINADITAITSLPTPDVSSRNADGATVTAAITNTAIDVKRSNTAKGRTWEHIVGSDNTVEKSIIVRDTTDGTLTSRTKTVKAAFVDGMVL